MNNHQFSPSSDNRKVIGIPSTGNEDSIEKQPKWIQQSDELRQPASNKSS